MQIFVGVKREMAKQGNPAPDYGNWVSKRLIFTLTLFGIILLASVFLFWMLVIPAALLLAVSLYFAYSRYLFSPKGGNVQNKIWDAVISNLDWNGQGKAIDIGCGNGALSIKLARKFEFSRVTGIDFWGERWEYSKSACEGNAKSEGVNERVVFRKASASKLPFADEYFDAAVSNLCFHEVSDTKDKHEVIREGLRVLKKGGKFAFQDLFLLKQVYGKPQDLVATLKSWGISKVEFVETRNSSFIPLVLKLPFMVGRVAIIKGEK
jgi:SAM-dependent methyltransferase